MKAKTPEEIFSKAKTPEEIKEGVREWIETFQKSYENSVIEEQRKGLFVFPPSHKSDSKRFLELIQNKVKAGLISWHPGCIKSKNGRYETCPVGRMGRTGWSELAKIIKIIPPLAVYVGRNEEQQTSETETDLDEILECAPSKGKPDLLKEYFPETALPAVANKCSRLTMMFDKDCEIYTILKTSGILKNTFPKWYREGFFEKDAIWAEEEEEEEKEPSKEILIGRKYRHYKGGIYQVENLGKLEETGEDCVIYSAVPKEEEEGKTKKTIRTVPWVRSLQKFTEQVLVETVLKPRFALLPEKQAEPSEK